MTPIRFVFPWSPSTSHIYVRASSTIRRRGMILTEVARRYKADASAIARIAMAEGKHSITSEPVRLEIDLHPPTRRKSDIDNRNKLILDALEGVLYHDDAQIVEMSIRKHECDGEGGRILVCALSPLTTGVDSC